MVSFVSRTFTTPIPTFHHALPRCWATPSPFREGVPMRAAVVLFAVLVFAVVAPLGGMPYN
ncbi:hypothetical protein GCM10022243_52770 [Saccharothrix violaceirubra]|uniref:Uncharacterized protein n=1 Tax=Saccharothrix violaceirubra TaxID=413306 RepID=A0A7W7SYL5_9PSEU|nr:hypothetical protein [Saccharothrix violaceirubra]MBB4963339.1 hypothetical protein [Saccharothrix violaceirubra]